MTIDKLIAGVLELDAKATKGPWVNTPMLIIHSENPIEIGNVEIMGIPLMDGHKFNRKLNDPDADLRLVANYRTAAPELARHCKRLMEQNARMRDALEEIDESDDDEEMDGDEVSDDEKEDSDDEDDEMPKAKKAKKHQSFDKETEDELNALDEDDEEPVAKKQKKTAKGKTR